MTVPAMTIPIATTTILRSAIMISLIWVTMFLIVESFDMPYLATTVAKAIKSAWLSISTILVAFL